MIYIKLLFNKIYPKTAHGLILELLLQIFDANIKPHRLPVVFTSNHRGFTALVQSLLKHFFPSRGREM